MISEIPEIPETIIVHEYFDATCSDKSLGSLTVSVGLMIMPVMPRRLIHEQSQTRKAFPIWSPISEMPEGQPNARTKSDHKQVFATFPTGRARGFWAEERLLKLSTL
jgi:hypothetical protein